LCRRQQPFWIALVALMLFWYSARPICATGSVSKDYVVVVLGSFESACSGVCLERASILAVFVAGVVGTRICPCWRLIHSPFLTVANSHSTSFFVTLVSNSCTDLLGSVCGLLLFSFYLLRLDLKPPVVGFNCFIFNFYIFMWLTGSGWCPPSFLCIIFYFMFNIFGMV
jgi:hypothetical protein